MRGGRDTGNTPVTASCAEDPRGGNAESTTCCSIHRHAGGYEGRPCKEAMRGVPNDMWGPLYAAAHTDSLGGQVVKM